MKRKSVANVPAIIQFVTEKAKAGWAPRYIAGCVGVTWTYVRRLVNENVPEPELGELGALFERNYRQKPAKPPTPEEIVQGRERFKEIAEALADEMAEMADEDLDFIDFKEEPRYRGEKARLKTTPKLTGRFSQESGCCRFVYNLGVKYTLDLYKRTEKVPSYAELTHLLMEWKQKYPFLLAANAESLQQALKHLREAWSRFLKGLSALPTFKKRGRGDSITYPQGFKFANNAVWLPKIGWVKMVNHRVFDPARVRHITVSRDGNRWFVSLCIEETPEELPLIAEPERLFDFDKIFGVDRNVGDAIVLSDGRIYRLPKRIKKIFARIIAVQKELSGKRKFSSNWFKCKRRLTALWQKVRNTRLDHWHKVTSKLAKSQSVFVLEDLQVDNMTRSARGTVEEPGKNVAAKAGLNRAVRNEGLSIFKHLLAYKSEWYGSVVLFVDPKYTSQDCHKCGLRSAESQVLSEAAIPLAREVDQKVVDECLELALHTGNPDMIAAGQRAFDHIGSRSIGRS